MGKILKLILIFLIIFIAYFYYSYNNFKSDILIPDTKIIEIKSGETIKDLSEKLDINSYFLKKYIEDTNSNFKLLAWRFNIKNWSKIENILKSMETPLPEKQINLTILEWWNIYDIDEYLTNKWLIKQNAYIFYVKNSKKIDALKEFYSFLKSDFISLEWYLYPDTYSLKVPLKINELVIKQLDNFEIKVYNKLFKETKLTNNIIYDVINLASIVEKEEKNPLEKSTVAWILKKRLQNWWKIWADITVCYPHKLTAEQCKMVVSKYIRERSEYNTRTMVWLPKTPIWNPSLETINATLNDKKTDYWFYLHNVSTWEIHYWKTDSEHEANKKYMY